MQPNLYWTQTSQYPQEQLPNPSASNPYPSAAAAQYQAAPHYPDPAYSSFIAQQQALASQWPPYVQQLQQPQHFAPAAYQQPPLLGAPQNSTGYTPPVFFYSPEAPPNPLPTPGPSTLPLQPAPALVASINSQGQLLHPLPSRPLSPIRLSPIYCPASIVAPAPLRVASADPTHLATPTWSPTLSNSPIVDQHSTNPAPPPLIYSYSTESTTPRPVYPLPPRPRSPTPPPFTETFSEQLDKLNMSADTNTMIAELQGMKVDQLKLTIRRFNETCMMHLRISGVKSDLYGRCRTAVYELAAQPDKTRFNQAKRIITEASNYHGGYSPSSSSASYGYQYQAPAQPARPAAPAYGGAASYTGYGGAALPAKPALPAPRFGAGAANAYASGSGANGDYGYGAGTNGTPAVAPVVPARSEEVPLLFRPNPFYKVERSLCGVTTLPKAGQGDRKSVVCNFALTEPQRTALAKSKASAANPQFQVRLYCTNEDYFNPHRASSSQPPAPIDFPATCEIKLNYINVPANTKGIKKQVGTASPVDLAKGGKLDITAGAINRLEVIYVNTEKAQTRSSDPPVYQRYFMVVYLVEVTTIKQLVDRVRTGKQKTSEEVIQSIVRMNSDPDMEASALTVSLKDPLTLARIKTPIRSNVCTHVSCFDAEVWFMINEQTPTWNCPICSKVLRVDDLVHDNFFADVLKTIGPAEVDAISVEPDGTWRSDNDKFGTATPKSVVPSRAGSVKPDISALNSADGSAAPEGKGKGKAIVTEALTLDSDDDDDDMPLAKRPRLNGAGGYRMSLGGTLSINSSPAPNGAGGAPPPPRRMETIDLTLSDSDDDAPPPPPPAAAARPPPAAHSAYVPPPPVPRPASSASSSNGAAGAGYGASDFQAQETLRKQLAEQAQRRQLDDIRRRREEQARNGGSGAGRPSWEGGSSSDEWRKEQREKRVGELTSDMWDSLRR